MSYKDKPVMGVVVPATGEVKFIDAIDEVKRKLDDAVIKIDATEILAQCIDGNPLDDCGHCERRAELTRTKAALGIAVTTLSGIESTQRHLAESSPIAPSTLASLFNSIGRDAEKALAAIASALGESSGKEGA